MSEYLSPRLAALEPYVPGEQPRDRSYVKLNTNESPFPPSPLAQRLARQAAGDLQLYSDPTCRSLKELAAREFGIAEENILFSNGSDEALNFAFLAFCGPDCPAVFPNVTYGFYKVFARLNGVPYREIPLKADFRVDVADYAAAGGTVFLANPNAPTGLAITREDVACILRANPRNVVVIDEAYVDFGGESSVELIRQFPNLLVVGTFSKSRSLAGGRLGWAIGSAELINDLEAVRYSVNPYNVNRMTMAAGIGALADREYFDRNRAKIIATRERVGKALSALGFSLTDSKANFLFARTTAMDGKTLYLKLKERGILVRHFDTDLLRDYVRITVGSDEEMDLLLDGIRAVLEVQ